ncbi:MAG: 30S ribosomal protein S21 [Candidatus Poribacteria bacterium]|jgi:small subunit ribosomal protein S21
MLEVRVNDGETVERALSRFKKKCEKEQLIKEIKKRERYEKPSERRRQRLLKSQRKNRKNYRNR